MMKVQKVGETQEMAAKNCEMLKKWMVVGK